MIRASRRTAPAGCGAIGKLVQRFVDDELDGSRTAVVDAHLATCDPCRQEVEAFRELKAALARGTSDPSGAVARLRTLGEELQRRG